MIRPKKIKPPQVMIYTIDRNTPYESPEKAPVDELHRIAGVVKAEEFDVQVSG